MFAFRVHHITWPHQRRPRSSQRRTLRLMNWHRPQSTSYFAVGANLLAAGSGAASIGRLSRIARQGRAAPSPGESMSRNDICAIAARDCVSGPMSRRLNDIGVVSPWGYVSGPLSRNDVRATAARDRVSGRPARLCNVALRLSRAYEGQHGCC